MSWDPDAAAAYTVVVNREEQYPVWLAGRDLPEGWRAEGFGGSKREGLDHVDQVWTDTRPLSLRNATR
ncbi:MbtH protein [Catenulispora sp. GAS73]|uniref:MbtH family protein n=1 Tax=Catenulispora sp. GAS73 TaxID=3156269 RepID=UPI003514EB93